ncbi:hypothetical protein HPP92_013775 [Vanilla planifolia]|uniref:Polygalacturonase n=2 Tax=Vanilla planifolia TaxID=51239 RepID=A0A835QXL8_VANPL|nr:hypothetical protein HPP92_013775 [Vanilla planifolia]
MVPKITLLLFLHLWCLTSHANFDTKLVELNFSEASFSHGMRAHPAYDVLDEEQCPLLHNTKAFMGSSQVMDMVVSVDDYGAKGGGADDTQAFLLAWKTACSSKSPVSLVVPKNNTYLLKPITFSGPCKSEVSVMIGGAIEASSNMSDWNGKNRRLWIVFSNLENLTVSGGGSINGNGQPCKGAPTAITTLYVGSLGAKKSTAQVSDVKVDKAQLHGTTNGVRIKTWQGGKGYAKDIVFENIDMYDVKNPIIIDQNYCDSKKKCKQQESAVKISNVQYKSIKGTSVSKFAIAFHCSKNIPCSDILLQDINLVEEGEDTKSFCENVKFHINGTVIPQPCRY